MTERTVAERRRPRRFIRRARPAGGRDVAKKHTPHEREKKNTHTKNNEKKRKKTKKKSLYIHHVRVSKQRAARQPRFVPVGQGRDTRGGAGGNKHSGGTRAHPQHKKSAEGEKGYTRERSRHQRSRHRWEFQHILLLPWPVRDLPTNNRFPTFAHSALCRDHLTVEIMLALKAAGGSSNESYHDPITKLKGNPTSTFGDTKSHTPTLTEKSQELQSSTTAQAVRIQHRLQTPRLQYGVERGGGG